MQHPPDFDLEIDIVGAGYTVQVQAAFAAKSAGVGQIWTINADGQARTQLTDPNAIDESPTWSPDGQRIAFDSNRERGYKIWVMNADGTGLRRLTDNSASNDGDVAWWRAK